MFKDPSNPNQPVILCAISSMLWQETSFRQVYTIPHTVIVNQYMGHRDTCRPYCSPFRYILEAWSLCNQHISINLSILTLHIFLAFCIQRKYLSSFGLKSSDYYFQTKCCCLDYVQNGEDIPCYLHIITECGWVRWLLFSNNYMPLSFQIYIAPCWF